MSTILRTSTPVVSTTSVPSRTVTSSFPVTTISPKVNRTPVDPSSAGGFDLITVLATKDPEVYKHVELLENSLKQAVSQDPNGLCKAGMSFEACGAAQALSAGSFYGALQGVFGNLRDAGQEEVAVRLASVFPSVLGLWLKQPSERFVYRVESAFRSVFRLSSREEVLRETVSKTKEESTYSPTLAPRPSYPTAPSPVDMTVPVIPFDPGIGPSDPGMGPSDPGDVLFDPGQGGQKNPVEEHLQLPEDWGGGSVPYWALGLAGVVLVGGVYFFTQKKGRS